MAKQVPTAVVSAQKMAPLVETAPLVRIVHRGPVAIITLDNPPMNILSAPVLDALAEAVVQLNDDPSVHALILTGAGDKGFTAGADIKEMVSMGRAAASRYSMKGQAVAHLLEASPVPVIAAVHGFCMGGGCELALACDFVLAADNALFGQPEINIGVIPGWGGSRRLTRAIGVVRARRWILTGERYPAQTAMDEGFVDRVVPRDRLMDEAIGLALTLASKGAVALAAAKYAVNLASEPDRRLEFVYERELWGMLFETQDQKEGMRAFLEKRPASFHDRADWGRRTRKIRWEGRGSLFSTSKRVARAGAHKSSEGSRRRLIGEAPEIKPSKAPRDRSR
jgi:enoyl-CoA hydratase